ncbi:MAG TPA: hypothetical protein VK012_05960 [Gemmatimonadales bacterium]|nr:hypothetical protein [Gemmatimonadales bacterium]
MTIARRILPLALVLGLGATGARAQAPADVSLDGRLDPAVASRVRLLVDSAVAGGLPARPLVNKALEGASKGAAGNRIIVAVQSLAADLRSARAALGPGATEPELVAGVGALRAGAGADVLARVKEARGSSSVLLPLAVLTDLVAEGIPVDRAAGVVLELAGRGAGDAQYREIPRAARPGRGGSARPTASPPPHAGPPAAGAPGRGVEPGTPPRGRPEGKSPPGRPEVNSPGPPVVGSPPGPPDVSSPRGRPEIGPRGRPETPPGTGRPARP